MLDSWWIHIWRDFIVYLWSWFYEIWYGDTCFNLTTRFPLHTYNRISNASSSAFLNPVATPPSNGIIQGLKYDKNLSDSCPWSSLCCTARPPRTASSSTVLIAAVPASSCDMFQLCEKINSILKSNVKTTNNRTRSLKRKFGKPKTYLTSIFSNPEVDIVQISTSLARGCLQRKGGIQAKDEEKKQKEVPPWQNKIYNNPNRRKISTRHHLLMQTF